MYKEWAAAAEELQGAVTFAQVDVSENSQLIRRFHATSQPTMYLFRNGKMYRYTGARLKEDLVAFATVGSSPLTKLQHQV
jgi:thioredoxin-like negative regulator of GroEL